MSPLAWVEKRMTHECGEVGGVLRRQSISSLLPRILILKIRKSENQKMAISLQSLGIENSRTEWSAWSNPKLTEKVRGSRLEFMTAIHMSSKGTLYFMEARQCESVCTLSDLLLLMHISQKSEVSTNNHNADRIGVYALACMYCTRSYKHVWILICVDTDVCMLMQVCLNYANS